MVGGKRYGGCVGWAEEIVGGSKGRSPGRTYGKREGGERPRGDVPRGQLMFNSFLP